MEHFWHFLLTFVHSKCKYSSLRSQCWMRLFLWFSNTVPTYNWAISRITSPWVAEKRKAFLRLASGGILRAWGRLEFMKEIHNSWVSSCWTPSPLITLSLVFFLLWLSSATLGVYCTSKRLLIPNNVFITFCVLMLLWFCHRLWFHWWCLPFWYPIQELMKCPVRCYFVEL